MAAQEVVVNEAIVMKDEGARLPSTLPPDRPRRRVSRQWRQGCAGNRLTEQALDSHVSRSTSLRRAWAPAPALPAARRARRYREMLHVGFVGQE